jgi:hypothetical protein
MTERNDEREGCSLHGLACPDGPLFWCSAGGVSSSGEKWTCSRKRSGSDEYCDAHQRQRRAGEALTPLPRAK